MTDQARYNPYLEKIRTHPVANEYIGAVFETKSGDALYHRIWTSENEHCVLIGVHGMAAHGELYVQVADQMIEHGVTTIALDLKHHGRSSGVKRDIEDFVELIDQLDEFVGYVTERYPDRPVFLMGNSMGGCIITNYAIKHRPDIAGIIPMGPAIYPHPQLSRSDTMKVPLLLALNLIAGGLPVVDVMKREGATTRNPDRRRYDETDPFRLRRISSRYLISANFWIMHAYKNAPRLHTPILLIHGGRDNLFPIEHIASFVERVPIADKQLVVYDTAYHCLFSDPVMEESGGWDTVRSWLREHGCKSG